MTRTFETVIRKNETVWKNLCRHVTINRFFFRIKQVWIFHFLTPTFFIFINVKYCHKKILYNWHYFVNFKCNCLLHSLKAFNSFCEWLLNYIWSTKSELLLLHTCSHGSHVCHCEAHRMKFLLYTWVHIQIIVPVNFLEFTYSNIHSKTKIKKDCRKHFLVSTSSRKSSKFWILRFYTEDLRLKEIIHEGSFLTIFFLCIY